MKKKRKSSNAVLFLLLLAGLSLLLYPGVSDYWNSFHSTQIISDYAGSVAGLDKKEYERMYLEAVEYNRELASHGGGSYQLSAEQKAHYESLLNVGGTGVMGYIEIPNIHVMLPIYHGTEDAVLQIASGHVEWTSLPVGGESSHCVLSGHRGLPSAKLFTNLDQLHEGDTFTIHILNETLTYEVDQIHIVKPEEIRDLTIQEGQDYCTLVTCTPYGINTHRLLVRGHRVEAVDTSSVVSEAIIIEPLLVAPVLAAPLLLALLIIVLLPNKNKSKKRGEDGHAQVKKTVDADSDDHGNAACTDDGHRSCRPDAAGISDDQLQLGRRSV